MIKNLKKVKLTGHVFLSTVWMIVLGTSSLLKYSFIHLSIKSWGKTLNKFEKCPLKTLFLLEVFHMKSKWKINDEVKCKLNQTCMRQA